MLLTLFYLHYVQCDDAHLFRGTSFSHTHTQKRETYSQKINCYERQKGAKIHTAICLQALSVPRATLKENFEPRETDKI